MKGDPPSEIYILSLYLLHEPIDELAKLILLFCFKPMKWSMSFPNIEVEKFCTNFIVSCSNDLLLQGYNLLNQIQVVNFRVVGKARHVCSFVAPYNCIFTLKLLQ